MAGPSGEKKARAMITSTGYCYSDPNQWGTQLQNPEIYSLATGMDQIIGFPSKNINQENENSSFLWKGLFNKLADGPKAMNEPTASTEFYQNHDFSKQHHDLTNGSLMVSSTWNNHHHHNRFLVEDPSNFRSCEGNQRPRQGLSLSLSSSNPSTIGLQSFEIGQNDDLRFGPPNCRSVNTQQQPLMQGQFQIRNSKYLDPAQELLNDFCNLGKNQTDVHYNSKLKFRNRTEGEDENNAIKKLSLYSLDLLELQKRKTNLLQMVQEVDRRYKHYCDRMKAVVSSFEAVAGNGAATVYSAMASRAMSRHFRCLRDEMVSQIKATNKVMGEKDTPSKGTTKGETPRLRLLEQTLRQERAFHQMNMIESHPWRPQRGLPERSVSVLRAWLFEHFLHPYPSDVDKHILARQTGLSRSQVSNWFINARVRLWKPMVEEMYLEDLKENENNGLRNRNEDEKPTQNQLMRNIDSECLSSMINNPNGKQNEGVEINDEQQHSFGRVGDEFGFDLSSFGHHSGGGSAVSLTLGLHQHGGVSLAFSQMEDCQTVEYSLLDSENQNLMGAQLLRHLAR